MIVFELIRWKNLLSTGNVFTEINLISHKSTLIVGANGAGKSTILDALSFGLYGKPFRKVNKPQLINSINQRSLVVEVEFTVGNKRYLVRRGQKPNVFEIHQNGTLINQSADSKDYQDHLEKNILKMNHKSFSQIVVLGSASFIPFMQLTAAHRREIIEDLLDIEIFTTMNTLLKDKIAANKDSMTSAEYEMKRVADRIEIQERHIQELEQSNEEQIQAKKQKIQGYTADVEVNQASAATIIQNQQSLTDSIADAASVRKKKADCEEVVRSLKNKAGTLNKELHFFGEHDNCPVCKQNIHQDHKQQIVDADHISLNEVNQAIAKVTTKMSKIEKRLAEIEQVNVQIAKLNLDLNSLNVNISLAQRYIAEIQKEIEELQTPSVSSNTNNQEIKKLRAQLKQLVADREKLAEQKQVFNIANTLLKDTGIKTKIIKQYVPIINKLINKYLAAMDFFVNFELNESFEEKIKSRFRDEFSYASFSEGEKSRLDLALLFTWRAVAKLRNSASTNLLILDEVFDGSLDNSGNDELLKILQNLTQGSNVFVISHKTDAFLDKFERVIKFEKHKNFSRIIDV